MNFLLWLLAPIADRAWQDGYSHGYHAGIEDAYDDMAAHTHDVTLMPADQFDLYASGIDLADPAPRLDAAIQRRSAFRAKEQQ